MITRTCKTCNIEKNIEEFAKRSKTKYRYKCKECQNSYARKKYNEGNYIEVINRKHERRKVELIEKQIKFLSGKSCKDCGIDNLLVLEFDHLRDKEYDICQMIQDRRSWKEILKEIKKCDVVCSNCHRLRTMKRANWLKYEIIKAREKSN